MGLVPLRLLSGTGTTEVFATLAPATGLASAALQTTLAKKKV